jgi:hypothetical protein
VLRLEIMAYLKARDKIPLRTKFHAQRESRGAIYQNGWVFLFIAACCFIYLNSIGKKNEVIASLDQKLGILNTQKSLLLQQKEDLLLQINSQSDPAWIQLVLMKGLGLVPEGQQKVYFYSDND